MAKWIKTLWNELTNLLTVKMPGSLRKGTVMLQEYSKMSKIVQRCRLSEKPLPKRRFTVLDSSNPNPLANRSFANVGSLALLLPSSSTKSCARSSWLQIKVRNICEEPWMMSDEEVMELITGHECADRLQHGIVSKYESNQLPSNNPKEDRRFVSRLLYDRDALLFGVLDGHGGDSCANNVAQRLSDYVGTALLPTEVLLSSAIKS